MNAKDLSDQLRSILSGCTIHTLTRDGQNVKMFVAYCAPLPPDERQEGQGNIIIADTDGSGLTLWARDVKYIVHDDYRVRIVTRAGIWRNIFIDEEE